MNHFRKPAAGFLSPGEVAHMLGIAVSTLARMRKQGKGPTYTQVSERHIIYAEADVEEWLLGARSNAR